MLSPRLPNLLRTKAILVGGSVTMSMTSLTSRKLSRGLAWGLAIVAMVLYSAPVHAVESGGIGGRPANPDPGNPRTESIFVFTVDPGQKADNAVKIYNNGEGEKTIDVYAVDSQISSGGAFACSQKVDERRNVGSWVKLSKQSVTLASGETETIPFNLEVPGNAAPGEHNGCIAIQESDQTPQAAGNGIALSFRSAIRVSVTVKGELKKELAFTRLEGGRGKEDKIAVNAALRNTGNVSLDTDIDVRVKSIFGTTVSKTGGEFPILAGGESEFNFETDEPFWGGVYFLSAKASYNPDPSAGLGDKSNSAAIGKSKLFVAVPKPMALVIELLVLAVVSLGSVLFIRRRRVHKRWHRHGKFYIVKEGESIQQVAEKFNLPWKTIAKVNRIKAPYHLKAGEHLRLLPQNLAKKTVPIKNHQPRTRE
jgi:hypothetical protein